MQEYRKMEYDELHRELKKLLKQAGRMMRWFNEDKRSQLLPALMAMKALVAQPGRRFPTQGLPSWEEECRGLGITAELVRKWKQRTASETDIRMMVGEDEYHGRRDRAAPPSLEFHRLKQMSVLVLNNEIEKAERLAAACAEEYGF